MNRQCIGKRPHRRLVYRPGLKVCEIVCAKVANTVVQQREHPVGLQGQDVDTCMQLTLEAQEW